MTQQSMGYILNLFVMGIVLCALGAAIDYFIPLANTLSDMGLMTQGGMDLTWQLTLCFYALGFIFMLAGGINIYRNANITRNAEV
jgi:hypothetical protein